MPSLFRVLEEIAAAVADRDKAVRAASLSTLTVVYDFEGTRIWKLLGRITSQQKSLIEERFKAHHRTLTDKGLAVGHRGSRPSTPASQASRLPTPDGTRKRQTQNQLLDSGSINGDTYPRPPSHLSGRSLQSPMPPSLPDPPEIERPPTRESTRTENVLPPPPDLPPGRSLLLPDGRYGRGMASGCSEHFFLLKTGFCSKSESRGDVHVASATFPRCGRRKDS